MLLVTGEKTNWSLFPFASCFKHSCQAINTELNLHWEESFDHNGLNIDNGKHIKPDAVINK